MMSIGRGYIFILTAAIFLAFAQNSRAQFYGWSSIGNGTDNGTNGTVNAITKFNNNLILGGYFTQAGAVSVSNLASWNGTSWSSLGGGMDDTVNALIVFNGSLIAGGKFLNAGGYPAYGIAKWNGTSWTQLGTGLNGRVNALAVQNGRLIAAGMFTNVGSNIASWDGNVWAPLGTGLNDEAYAITVFGSFIFAGGKFTIAGGVSANKIAQWNGSSWDSLSTGMNNDVLAITAYGSNVVAGGRFTQAGGNNAQYIAQWNGVSWSRLFSPDSPVYALAYYNSSLIVGGSFTSVIVSGGSSLFVNRICKWDVTGCTRMITGANQRVKTLNLSDSSLYAGGDFTSAGGDYSFHTAAWSNLSTHTISGTAHYADNNQILTTGIVKAVRMDVSTREVILIDSALIQPNGTYQITHGIHDSTDIVLFPNDELDHFVPTYYPSTTDWNSAVKIFPSVNLTNIDIYVIRKIPDSTSFSNISGHVYLNFNPVLNQPGFPFSKDAIIYAKQGSIYRQFAVSDSSEKYTLTGLSPGTYDLFVNRLGYISALRTVTLGTTNLDTINFYLDTAGVIGIVNINSNVPENFKLFQNYPNPFNPNTTIRFDIKTKSFVSLNIYNVLGQRIRQIVNEELQPGEYKSVFNALDLPSGIYFYKLVVGDNSGNGSFADTRKMILIK
jgi:hypothetical protein